LKTIRFLEERFQVNKSAISAIADVRREQRADALDRYLTWKKMFNFARIEVQLRMGRTEVSGYPYEWELDTTNICQLQCPLCQTGLGQVNREQGVMHFDTFKKVIDEVKEYCMWLTLYSWGEPFLNKDIDRYIWYAHQAGIATSISTNLNKPLTGEMVEDLVRSGLDTMIVSLDGITQEVYEQYRVLGHLDRVFENLKLVVAKKKELGSSTPHIEWQFIVMRQNQHQIPEARALAKELGVDSIIFKKVDFPLGEEDSEAGRKWLPVGDGFERDDPFGRPFDEGGDRCWRLWRSSVINWDGGAAPCCYLTDKKDDFGNVTKDSFKSVWNNEHYKSARALFMIDEPLHKSVGCLTCPAYTSTEAARRRGHGVPAPSGAPPASQNGHGDPTEISYVGRSNGHPPEGAVSTGTDGPTGQASKEE
jgi:MoaA/NifB/PqqE/SkfB family radical SAM enzyme